MAGAGADAPAISYEVDGTQYIAIAVGGVSIQTTSTNSDMIWVFSLKGTPGDRLKPFAPPRPPENVVGFSGPVARANAIKIEDYPYGPQRITVAAGTKVTFTNNGSQPHNAMSADAGGWDTGMLSKGEAASVTFNLPGSYTYICTPHPSMIGQIIVTGAPVAGMPPTVVDKPGGARPQAGEHGAH